MSTASQVADALLGIVVLQLTGCGPPPGRDLVYHGKPPQFCCTEEGTLSIRWTHFYYSDTRPGPAPASWSKPPGGRPTIDFTLRLDRCWPKPSADIDAWLARDDDYDARAKVLIDDMLAVSMRLTQVACDKELADLTGCRYLSFVDASPVPAFGGCAAVEWRVTAGLYVNLADMCIDAPAEPPEEE